MNPNQVIDLLTKLGELLSPSMQQAWDIAYRQTFVDIWMLLILGVLFFAIAIGLLFWGIHDSEREDSLTYGGVQYVISCFAALGTIICWSTGFSILANPAWHTIELLSGMVH